MPKPITKIYRFTCDGRNWDIFESVCLWQNIYTVYIAVALRRKSGFVIYRYMYGAYIILKKFTAQEEYASFETINFFYHILCK